MYKNPLEQFEILDLFSISILNNYKISLTNMGLYIMIVTLLLIGIQLLIRANESNQKIINSRFSLVQETIYDTILSIVRNQIGTGGSNEKYFPFIISLFLFILFSNLTGMIPYSFTTTSHLVLTFSLSVAILIGVTIIGFKIHKLSFFSLFIPVGTPLVLVPLLVLIELISYFARALSLGLRLGANIISGHLLLKILSTFIYAILKHSIIFFIIGLLPVAIFTALIGLELAIAFIQAIVFIMLTSSYIRDVIYLH